jgi:hypothetical protein
MDYPALFSSLARLGFQVYGLRQTLEGDWEAQLHHEHSGRMIDRICRGPTPYLALANCADLVQWSISNPPKPAAFTKGSLDELLSIAKSSPAYSALTPADVKSLKL